METPPDPPSQCASESGERATSVDLARVPRGIRITRKAVAEALGVSKSTVRRLEEDGDLTPAEIRPDGTRLFDVEQVRSVEHVERRVVRTRAPASSPDAYDGLMAQTAFDLFDAKVELVDVVKRTGFDPRAVAAMYHQWCSLRGGFFVPGSIAAQIAGLPWLFGRNLALPGQGTAENLLECLKVSHPSACTECGQQYPDYVSPVCSECARTLSVKEATRRAAAAQQRRVGKSAELSLAQAERALRTRV
jgi:transcriptional regulator with XRE-family HTH domain